MTATHPMPTTPVSPANDTALVIGEALIDIVTSADLPPQEIPGGSPANVALGLARLGRRTQLSCWIGNDARGKAIQAHLAHSEVKLSAGSDQAERTSTAHAYIGADHSASYVFDLLWDPPAPQLAKTDFPVLLHTGSIAAILEPGARTVRQAMQYYHAYSTICYDPNVRPQLMGQPDSARSRIEDLVALADLVKCSNEDLAWLYQIDPHSDSQIAAAMQRWQALGAALVVVTCGKAGAWASSSAGAQLHVPADPHVAVVDTVGAGDSFMAGLEDGLWSAGLLGASQRQNLHAIAHPTLEQVVRHAAKIADITVSRAGANPPYRAELESAS